METTTQPGLHDASQAATYEADPEANREANREAFCPYFHRAIELVGARWTGAVIRAMLAGVARFSELSETIPGMSDRMLSERLKELEAEGIVSREVTPSTPVRVTYHLTEKGRALGAVLDSVSVWASEWLAPPAT